MNRNKVAPEVTMINGVPHMLAYVNRAEKDMLRAVGGTGLAGPDGIPAYGFWDNFVSNVKSAACNFARDISAAPKNIARDVSRMPNQISRDVRNFFSGDSSSDFAQSVKNSNNVSQFLPPTSGGSSGSNSIEDTYNIQAAAADRDPTGVSTQDYYIGSAQLNPSSQTNTSTNDGSSGSSVDNSALLAALADRDAALAAQMSSLSDAFGSGTDDYYSGLKDNYATANNSAFQTAYDDAMRGIYEGFKSAGLLTQSAVDQDVSKLGAANTSETSRLGTAAEEYAKANRQYVDQGRSGIEGQLNALAFDANTADAYRQQADAIRAFDVAGAAKPFRTPTESSVADFFSDFAKRSYDPSYNVAPTEVASAGPSRVTQSVQQFGSNTQPSSMVGLRSPYKGRSTRVVT